MKRLQEIQKNYNKFKEHHSSSQMSLNEKENNPYNKPVAPK
jgi:hypothetical protein